MLEIIYALASWACRRLPRCHLCSANEQQSAPQPELSTAKDRGDIVIGEAMGGGGDADGKRSGTGSVGVGGTVGGGEPMEANVETDIAYV